MLIRFRGECPEGEMFDPCRNDESQAALQARTIHSLKQGLLQTDQPLEFRAKLHRTDTLNQHHRSYPLTSQQEW